MASSSSSPQPKDENHAFSGIEPEGIRRKVSESTTLYDLFINHRGPDSKYSLALPLYTSLKELGIRAFLDLEEMDLGQSFPSTIETAIHSAAVHIAIFSKRYAESPWCLAELVLMLHSPAKIIPIFYEVEPSALRYIEKGVYGDAFIGYQKKSRYLDKLHKWKEALQSISFTTGYEMNDSNIGDHRSILSAVQREVQRIKPLHVARYPVALDKLVQEFERRCLHNLVHDFEIHCGMNKEEEGKAQIVGIFGMGGVGKTTLSKELFNRKRQQYARACFLFDVREASVRYNLPSLQMKLLKDLFGEKDLSFQSTEEGSSRISNCIERSTSLSFLIVLDDIDHLAQLDALSITHMLEKPGNSLVIITTRDVGILIAEGIKVGYHLKGMDKDDARQLFSWHAFSQPHPPSGYEELVDDFLRVCGGLPLSLQVLGRHVYDRDENYWRLELQKLGRTMHEDVRKSLKISFDALNTEEKQIFMDMACFFVDQLKCIAIRVWKASGWSAENGLQALKDKCLVEEIDDSMPVLRMHDHLRDLGREMAHELKQPRRLWHPQVLKKMESKGLENIIAQTKGRCFHSIFDKALNCQVKFFLGESDDSADMSSCLLLLHLWYPYIHSGPYSSNLNHLRHLQHKSLTIQSGIPSWIPLQNMQCLRISNGHFERLWQHDAEAPSELKKLEIYGTFLEEYPDFLGILAHVEKKVDRKVEKEVNEDQHISAIKSLIVKTVRRFSGSLPTTSARESSSFKAPLNGGQKSATVKTPMSMLEDLVIKEQGNIRRIVIDGNYCPSLQSLELSSVRNLIEVQFTRVETLNCLNVSKCEYLKILSVTSDLKEFKDLSISECPMLEELNLGHLSCLKRMRIESCTMYSVPGIFNLKMLVELNISRCPKLQELCLAHLHFLEKITVNECDHLKSVTGLSHLLKLVEVSFSWCGMLQLDICLVGLNSLKRIKADRSVKVKCFELKDCKNLETVSGISFGIIQMVNICGCPELKNFPVICGRRCLELIIIEGCGKLNNLTLIECGILNRVSGNFDLYGLSILNCPMLKALPSFEPLIYLEEIRIFQCGSLQNMTLPTTVKRLELNSCKELKTIVGISGLTKLAELNVKRCPKLRLELNLSSLNQLKRVTIVECWSVYNMTLPTTLIGLTVQRCMKLQFAEGIGHLTKLTELHICECPVIEKMPVVCGLSCLERITIDGWSKFSFLQVADCAILKAVRGILDMGHLAQLWISDCPELEELPCFARLNFLVEIHIVRCSKLQKITLPRTLKNLQLESCKELKSVSEISCLTNLEKLIISQCGQLELELHLEAINSLQSITFDGCGKLKSFLLRKCQNLKRVLGNFDVEWISICGCHELEELSIRDCPGLSCLKKINIESCDKLDIITLPAKLTNLIVQRCRHLQRISGMDDLTVLCISECEELDVLPILARLSCLIRIKFESCQKLHNITLPMTLKKLTVRCCQKLQTVAAIGNLSKLTELHISKCPDLGELPVLFHLSSLESITIDGCGKLNRLKVVDCGISKGVSHSFDLGRLGQLWISDCPELEELPCLARLTCLQGIGIFRCMKLQRITLPLTLKNLHLDSCKELKSVSDVSCLTNLVELIISECGQLEFELCLEDMDSLQTIASDDCGKIKSFQLNKLQNLKRVSGNFDVKWISICGCDELEELSIRECPGQRCLEKINIESCDRLRNITLPTNLTNLAVQRCRHLQRIAGMDDLTALTYLYISKCPQLEELPSFAGLRFLERITIDSNDKLHNLTLPTTIIELKVQLCRGLQMVTGITNLTKLEDLSISECPQLEELPSFAGLSFLERITVEYCDKLHSLTLPTTLIKVRLQWCRNLQKVAGMDDLTKLEDLSISECPQLSCDKLHSLTLATTLIKVELQQCRNLQKVLGMGDLTKLEDLSISECPQLEELPSFAGLSLLKRITIESCDKLHSLTLPTTLIKVILQWCRNLQVVAGMGNFTKLTELHISECPVVEEMPVVHGLSCLERITIDGCVKFSYLQVIDCAILKEVRGNLDMAHLAQLMISDCPKLEELPSFACLTFLVEIRILRCRKLQKVTLPRTLKNLQLDSCQELKSVSEISHLKNLVELVISRCGQLELELHLEDMDFLQTIASDGCGKIESFQLNKLQNLKRLSGNFDVEWISICGCPELQELSISDCPGLHCLKKINIESCDKLQNITLPAKLTNLIVQACRHLQRIAGMGGLSKVTELHISKCPDLEELPIHFDLSSLESITIDECGKLNRLNMADCGMSEGLPCSFDLAQSVPLWISDCPALGELACFAHLTCLERISIIRNTKLQKITFPITLKNLHLDSCKELKQVAIMGHLSMLTELYISECPLIEELILGGQSCLEGITIYSCEKLHKITLPTTLTKLTVQWCRKLQMVAAMGCLSNLTDMFIGECPELEELPNLAQLSCLESIKIDSCQKLNNVTLPINLNKLTLRKCRGSQMLAAFKNLTKLEELSICGYPELEEFPSSTNLSCLKMIAINSCENFHNITLPTTLIKLRVQGCRELPFLGRLSLLKS